MSKTMQHAIYRGREAERGVLDCYDIALKALSTPADSRFIETIFGRTHLLIAGPRDAPPLLLLGGGNFLNPTCLGWFGPLMERYRVYAPDLIGQPGLSAAVRPSPHGDGHARWLIDILDILRLERVPLIGISYGAGLILRLAGLAPKRIAALALISPAGLITGPLGPLLSQIVIPMLAYRLAPSPQRLAHATAPILSQASDELAVQIGVSYRFVRLDTGLPRHANADELRHLDAPVLVIAGADDPFFPGVAVLNRANAIFPHAIETLLLPASRHIPTLSDFATINARIAEFLDRA